MEQQETRFEDTILPLAGIVVSASTSSGAAISSVVMWNYNPNWWLVFIAFVAGAIFSWGFAETIGSVVFPARREGDIYVVKANTSALPHAIAAAMIGSSVALLLCGYIFAFILGGSALFSATWVFVTTVSVLISCVLGGIVSASMTVTDRSG